MVVGGLLGEGVQEGEDIMEGAIHDCHPSAPKAKRPGLLCLVSATLPPLTTPSTLPGPLLSHLEQAC